MLVVGGFCDDHVLGEVGGRPGEVWVDNFRNHIKTFRASTPNPDLKELIASAKPNTFSFGV